MLEGIGYAFCTCFAASFNFPNIYTSQSLHFKVNQDLIRHDDRLIDNLIKQTNKLKETTEEMWSIFHETNANNTEDILFKDVCSAISKTDTELRPTVEKRTVRIDNLIQNIPDLSPFDLFVVQVINTYTEKRANYRGPHLRGLETIYLPKILNL